MPQTAEQMKHTKWNCMTFFQSYSKSGYWWCSYKSSSDDWPWYSLESMLGAQIPVCHCSNHSWIHTELYIFRALVGWFFRWSVFRNCTLNLPNNQRLPSYRSVTDTVSYRHYKTWMQWKSLGLTAMSGSWMANKPTFWELYPSLELGNCMSRMSAHVSNAHTRTCTYIANQLRADGQRQVHTVWSWQFANMLVTEY